MVGRVLRCVVLVILAAMLAGQVTELFDHWDHTLRTGREADYTLVVIAACAGLEIVLAKGLITFFRSLRANQISPTEALLAEFSIALAETLPAGPSPPFLVSLRI